MLRLANPRALETVDFRPWDFIWRRACGQQTRAVPFCQYCMSMAVCQCGCAVASDLARSRRPRALQHIGQSTSEWRSWPSSPETYSIVPWWNRTQLLGARIAPPSRRFTDWASHCRAPSMGRHGQALAGLHGVARDKASQQSLVRRGCWAR